MATEDLIRRASALADMGRFEEAEPLLARALAGEPDNEAALRLLGHTLVQRFRFQDAADVTERLLHVNPDDPAGLLRMAVVLSALRRTREGVPFARRAVELYPDNPTCLVQLADTLNTVTPGSAEALAVARRAIAIEPDYARAHRMAGKVNLDVQQYAEAERATLEALRIDPVDWQAVLQLGLARAGLGRFAESRDQVSAALSLHATPATIDEVIDQIEGRGLPPHFAEIYRMALAARGRPDLSHPGAAAGDLDLLAAQGRLARRMHVLEAGPDGMRRAGELADAVLAALPGNADARYVRSLELSRARRYEQALSLAEELATAGYPKASLALLQARLGLRDYASALNAARQVLADEPDNVLYLRAESYCLRNLGRYDEALRSARRAVELVPAGHYLQLELGLAAKEAGDAAAAEQALRAAVAAAPGEGLGEGELALLLAEAGRWPEAESLIAGLPADAPDSADIARSCAKMGAVAITGFEPWLEKITDTDDPDPEALAESARWLGLAARMWVTMVSYHAEALATFGNLRAAVNILRGVAAPPGSAFAEVVRDFEELLSSREVSMRQDVKHGDHVASDAAEPVEHPSSLTEP